ncbi:protein SCAF11 isoform X5 [Manis javanica]|uniref:protein SCAF11 isoform X5 n=1 Tax=Manis javanica TaxID=9974 RepID=UPI003C6D3D83
MKKKTVYTLNVGDQDCEDMEGEENKENTASTGLLYSEADRCPICLNCLLEKEVGFPESCNHVFCMTCILKWAETLASCPIDRKPFQAVFKLNAVEGYVKVQVKRQLRETKDKKNESPFKKRLSCHENSKSCMRKKVLREDLLSTKPYDLKMIHRNYEYSEMGGEKNAIIKINKARRSNQCTSQHSTDFVPDVFSSGSHTAGPSTCRARCTEFLEVHEISALIRQKRQELELSWFPDTSPGIGRNDFIPWNIESEVPPFISSVLPRAVFSTSTISLQNFGTCWKGCALAHPQEGEEKQQTSGASQSRGSRRKPAAAPARRSTRSTRAEAGRRPPGSPAAGASGCGAPDPTPPVSVPSAAEPERRARQAPKRKSVRRGRKPPPLKKKLQSSVPPPERPSSSDSAGEEKAESDPSLGLDVDSGHTSVRTDGESESAHGLRICSEHVEDVGGHAENHDTERRVGSPSSEPCTQDPVLLGVEEEDVEKAENTGIGASILCSESKISESISEKGNHPLENQIQISGPSESDTCTDHPPHDFLPCSGPEIEVDQLVPGPGTLAESTEPAVNRRKVRESSEVGNPAHEVSAVKTEERVDSPESGPPEGATTRTAGRGPVADLEAQLLAQVGTEDAETGSACGASGHGDFNSVQDSENNVFENILATKLDKSLEEKTESLVEHSSPTELPNTHIEQIQKHFSEDNNEMISMECDSFCSDQNESEIGPSVNADAKQLNANSVEHSSQNNMLPSDSANEKVESVSQPSESPVETAGEAKKPRTRRSRFHSPSTTWSPSSSAAREKRAQSPSPKREPGTETRGSRSPSPKKEASRGRRRPRSQSPSRDGARERRRSQSRSPKRDGTREGKRSASLSPKRDASRESRGPQSRVRGASPQDRPRSRSREREGDRAGPRRERGRERRPRRWSRSRSRSRSPSRSRAKSKNSSFGRSDRDSYSPRWQERRAGDSWRCPRGGERSKKSNLERQNENTRKERNDNSTDAEDPNSVDKHRNDCPSWVIEKINSGPDPRTRHPEKLRDSHWEESRSENSGNCWNQSCGSGWASAHGGGAHRGGSAHADPSENRWQNRRPLSGNSNSSGSEPFKSAEQQPCKRRGEQQFAFATPADRSGWTSASGWAVRRTLPADVQSYYSRRARGASGPLSAWLRHEEGAAEPGNLFISCPDRDCRVSPRLCAAGRLWVVV